MTVPNILSDAWLKGNFLIPADDDIRRELLKVLEGNRHSGFMFLPGNENARTLLEARIEAIIAYNNTTGAK
jgi:hypothetical protein